MRSDVQLDLSEMGWVDNSKLSGACLSYQIRGCFEPYIYVCDITPDSDPILFDALSSHLQALFSH